MTNVQDFYFRVGVASGPAGDVTAGCRGGRGGGGIRSLCKKPPVISGSDTCSEAKGAERLFGVTNGGTNRAAIEALVWGHRRTD